MLAMTSNENIVSILKISISVTFFISLFAVFKRHFNVQ
ncbi:hypothetical protein bcere0004_43060 [Bacillus cereus BGSC 6E1]|nr:hypothetical protein bcere0004_43060 [Bacillus cereus BGSC 6E1]